MYYYFSFFFSCTSRVLLVTIFLQQNSIYFVFPRSPAAVEMSSGNSCCVPWRRSLVSVEWPLYHGLLCMDTENKVIICRLIFILIYIFQHCLFLTLWASSLSSSASVIIIIIIIIIIITIFNDQNWLCGDQNFTQIPKCRTQAWRSGVIIAWRNVQTRNTKPNDKVLLRDHVLSLACKPFRHLVSCFLLRTNVRFVNDTRNISENFFWGNFEWVITGTYCFL